MARVLISGGAGFIGARTARRLAAAGDQGRLLDVLDPQIHGPWAGFPKDLPAGIETVWGGGRDRGALDRALRGIDAVYHFAARAGTGQGRSDIADYVDTNVGGTAALLDRMVRLPRTTRLVLLSSGVQGRG